MKRADHPHAPPVRGLLMALMAIAAASSPVLPPCIILGTRAHAQR